MLKLKVIVTAGGTSEKIDEIRSITNRATGRLGSLVAEGFLSRLSGADTVYYVCSENAARPRAGGERLKVLTVSDTCSLRRCLEKLLGENRIDAVVHSMAVSDYKTFHVTTADRLAREICGAADAKCAESVYRRILSSRIDSSSKISSDIEHPVLVLEKTPKIISIVKDLSPETVLVGFKLLDGVSREVLVETAWRLLLKNRCDFVLANDAASISQNSHDGILIDDKRNCTDFHCKEAIATGIVGAVLAKTGVSQ